MWSLLLLLALVTRTADNKSAQNILTMEHKKNELRERFPQIKYLSLLAMSQDGISSCWEGRKEHWRRVVVFINSQTNSLCELQSEPAIPHGIHEIPDYNQIVFSGDTIYADDCSKKIIDVFVPNNKTFVLHRKEIEFFPAAWCVGQNKNELYLSEGNQDGIIYRYSVDPWQRVQSLKFDLKGSIVAMQLINNFLYVSRHNEGVYRLDIHKNNAEKLLSSSCHPYFQISSNQNYLAAKHKASNDLQIFNINRKNDDGICALEYTIPNQHCAVCESFKFLEYDPDLILVSANLRVCLYSISKQQMLVTMPGCQDITFSSPAQMHVWGVGISINIPQLVAFYELKQKDMQHGLPGESVRIYQKIMWNNYCQHKWVVE